MIQKSIKILFLALFVYTISVSAWDDAGHKTIAYIAWERMSPEAREKAFRILMSAPEDADLSVFYTQDSRSEAIRKRELFMIASTWADIVRDRKFKNRFEKYHKSNWHYDDTFWSNENGQVKILENPNEEGGKAVENLYAFEKVLQSKDASDEEKAIALAWIEHLVGDLHQPLHTSARITEFEPKGDQGGNLFLLNPKDTPREKSENLHWFWDSILGRNIPRNDACDGDYISKIAAEIMKKYPFAKMQNRLQLGEFRNWQKEGFQLATTDVFSPDLKRFETPSVKYKQNAFQVSQAQMALAGYRLGEMLNRIFGGESTAQSEVSRENFEKEKSKYEKSSKQSGSNIGQGANDLWLWTKTKSALATTGDLRDSTINVDVENSFITLRGTVRKKAHKKKAEEIVKGIEGVTGVKNLLEIN